MADPGFPIGRRGPRSGGWSINSRGGYVLNILYVEMKESGSFGGFCMLGTPPRSANAIKLTHLSEHCGHAPLNSQTADCRIPTAKTCSVSSILPGTVFELCAVIHVSLQVQSVNPVQ